MNREEILQRLLDNPQDGNWFFRLAESLFRELDPNRDREKALWAAVCYLLAAHFQDDPRTWGVVGSRLRRLRMSPRLQKDCFTKALERNPHDLQSLIGRGMASMRLGEYREALRDFEAACRNGDPSPLTRLNMGRCWHSLGNSDRARECFREALAMSQGSPDFDRVREGIRQLGGYEDLLPAVGGAPDPKAPLRARIDEMARLGLPQDLAARLREGVEARSVEEAERFMEAVTRYWDLYRQGSLKAEDLRKLIG
jgi:tetratricopeptide (TPR) repeat protein